MPVVDGTVALTLDWPRGTLLVGRSIFDVAELPLAVEGRVDELRKTPVVNLRVGTPGEVGLDHVSGLPGIAGRFPENVKLCGQDASGFPDPGDRCGRRDPRIGRRGAARGRDGRAAGLRGPVRRSDRFGDRHRGALGARHGARREAQEAALRET